MSFIPLMLRRLPSLVSQATRTNTRSMSTQSHPDYYVAVQEGGSVASSAASSQIPQLWQASRAKDKDTRVFYNVDGATVVAVGTGKAKERKGGEAEENALKEQARRTVRC